MAFARAGMFEYELQSEMEKNFIIFLMTGGY